MNRPLGPEDLMAYMQAMDIQGEIIHLSVPTPTVEAAAQAVNTQPQQIIKSIVFLVDGQPVLAIACGQTKVDHRSLAAIYGVGRKKVKLAPAEIVLQETGYEVGAMPPFGHRSPLPTLIDRHVLEQSEVFAGGGAENALLRLSADEIMYATRAKVLDLLNPPESNVNPCEE